MKETYEFMRMPCEFRHSFINESSEPDMKQWNKCGMSPFPKETPIGMAYVPYQQWEQTYDAKEGFSRGTIFPELDLPFAGGDCTYE
ncbi:MAG: spore coat associated protein CotJA [Ruminococcus sp.]